MTFATEISDASRRGVDTARAAALAAKLQGQALGDAALEGKWISINEILALPSITNLTAEQKAEITKLLSPYAKHEWMIEPANGADLDTILKASRYRMGGKGSTVIPAADAEPLITNLRVVDGLIAGASLFVPHGQPTAPKSKRFDGIAEKFATDHLCKDAKGATSASERRSIARSTMLHENEAKLLSKEMEALNNVSYFQYVEAYLETALSWVPSYLEVEGICYVSKESVKVAWEISGTASTAGGPINTFTKPAKATGHLVFAVKPDEADRYATTEPKKSKRLLYHFGGLVASKDAAPAGDWIAVTVEQVLKVANIKSEAQKTAIRAAALPCYYKSGEV